jgi:hypothetical protein
VPSHLVTRAANGEFSKVWFAIGASIGLIEAKTNYSERSKQYWLDVGSIQAMTPQTTRPQLNPKRFRRVRNLFGPADLLSCPQLGSS